MVPAPMRACRCHPLCDRGPGTAIYKKQGKKKQYLLDWIGYSRAVSREIPPTDAEVFLVGA